MKKYNATLIVGKRFHRWTLTAKDHEAAKIKAFRRFDVKGKNWMFGTKEVK